MFSLFVVVVAVVIVVVVVVAVVVVSTFVRPQGRTKVANLELFSIHGDRK